MPNDCKRGNMPWGCNIPMELLMVVGQELVEPAFVHAIKEYYRMQLT